MDFSYYDKDQADQYSFIRIPRAMMTEEILDPLSMESKMLYGLLLDKMSLSFKNQWLDDDNRAYVLYPISEIMEDMNISKKKAMASLNELSDMGLVEKKPQGFGRPSVLYVKKFKIQSAKVPYRNHERCIFGTQ